MKFLIAFFTAALLSIPVLAQPLFYGTNLDGADQVPPVVTPITGQFLFRLRDNRWFLAVKDAPMDDKITAAHIHCGKVGENGPVVYPFWTGPPSRRIYPKSQFDDSKFVAYTPSSTCPVLIRNIRQLKAAIEFELIYVNVHTVLHPAGTVRGQVTSFTP